MCINFWQIISSLANAISLTIASLNYWSSVICISLHGLRQRQGDSVRSQTPEISVHHTEADREERNSLVVVGERFDTGHAHSPITVAGGKTDDAATVTQPGTVEATLENDGSFSFHPESYFMYTSKISLDLFLNSSISIIAPVFKSSNLIHLLCWLHLVVSNSHTHTRTAERPLVLRRVLRLLVITR